MNKTLTLTALAVALYAGPAAAQANRTFVSGNGSDANPCSLAAPCRSFAQAVTQTNAGGEVAVLDTAGYGAVTITKALSIINQDGVEAGVTVTSGDGITVAAGAGDVVNLRGLTIVGIGGSAINGITFNTAKSLTVDKCEIRGFAGNGIIALTSGTASLTVTDTTVSNNLIGVQLEPETGAVAATLARLHATGNGTGLLLDPFTGVFAGANVFDSLLDNNGSGIVVTASGGGTLASVTVDNSKLYSTSGPSTNLSANGAGAKITAGRSQFIGVSLGTTTSGGTIQSYGNNQTFNLTGSPATL